MNLRETRPTEFIPPFKAYTDQRIERLKIILDHFGLGAPLTIVSEIDAANSFIDELEVLREAFSKVLKTNITPAEFDGLFPGVMQAFNVGDPVLCYKHLASKLEIEFPKKIVAHLLRSHQLAIKKEKERLDSAYNAVETAIERINNE